ncbi:BRO-N domain-containing protein [Paenibacillus amylolyticus]|uniref:BRO-N domain-containing protein n=1 Tax=Paenibacillus amylolyticus TaxID=1451 RepID=UPI003D9762BC
MIKTFENELFGQIRTMMRNEEVLFNLYDAGISLGYTTVSKGRTYLHKSRVVDISKTLGITGLYAAYNFSVLEILSEIDFDNTYISEEDLYDLIFESKAKNSRQFRKWVTNEVLPSIRRDGMYISDEATHEQVKYNVSNFMTNLDDYNITKLYSLIEEFLAFHRQHKTRLLYKRKNSKHHGNKKLKDHIESMEDIRNELISFLDAKIQQFNDSRQAGLAQEYVRIKGMVGLKVENMRYRTAACR